MQKSVRRTITAGGGWGYTKDGNCRDLILLRDSLGARIPDSNKYVVRYLLNKKGRFRVGYRPNRQRVVFVPGQPFVVVCFLPLSWAGKRVSREAWVPRGK